MECVDNNIIRSERDIGLRSVALHAECVDNNFTLQNSPPVRSAGIETTTSQKVKSRWNVAPRMEARIATHRPPICFDSNRRTLCGCVDSKCLWGIMRCCFLSVAPYTGAWISTLGVERRRAAASKVAPHAGAWIIMALGPPRLEISCQEHFAWSAWISIAQPCLAAPVVALRAERVVNNGTGDCLTVAAKVAPHAGAWITTVMLPDGRYPS